MKYSRLHSGGGIAGYSAEFALICVHIVVESPISSKPVLQVYIAVLLTELPPNVLMPFTIAGGSEHSAASRINVTAKGKE